MSSASVCDTVCNDTGHNLVQFQDKPIVEPSKGLLVPQYQELICSRCGLTLSELKKRRARFKRKTAAPEAEEQ